ncbi:hypothetical protein D3C74_50120 [compost metagenome]
MINYGQGVYMKKERIQAIQENLEILENAYDFNCEAGPLSFCLQFQQLKKQLGLPMSEGLTESENPLYTQSDAVSKERELMAYAREDAEMTENIRKILGIKEFQGKIHDLKLLSKYFVQTWDNKKLFEIRYDDRSYRIGDALVLREYTGNKKYTGRIIKAKVTSITSYAQREGYVCMGIEIIEKVDSNVDVAWVRSLLNDSRQAGGFVSPELLLHMERALSQLQNYQQMEADRDDEV